MKMFIWDSIVLAQYAFGNIIVAAESLEEARLTALNEYADQFAELHGRVLDSGWREEFLKDLSAEPVIRDLPCAILIDGSA